jgi:hypothetical protein
MSSLLKVLAALAVALTVLPVRAQHIKGKIIDAITKEPVAAATVHCTSEGCTCGCAANLNGEFDLISQENCCHSFSGLVDRLSTCIVQKEQLSELVTLQPANSIMETIVVSA